MAKKKRARSEREAKTSLVKLCCYVALILAALLILVTNVLPLLGLNIGGPILGAIVLVRDIALLLGIAFGAYSFACSSGKAAIIIYWIAIAVYVASAICGLF